MANKRQHRVIGEPWVWLAGMGLAIGLLMVGGLMLVILVNGLEAFWPKRVVEVHLQAGVTSGPAAAEIFDGEIVKQQDKKSVESRIGASEKGVRPREWQLYVGNKDIYGASFYYIDEDHIQSVSYPPSVMLMERLEYGNAIAYPQLIRHGETVTVRAGDAHFNDVLHRLVSESVERWGRIRKLEKVKIGRINRKLEALKLDKKGVDKLPDGSRQDQELAEIEKERKTLQEQYEDLAAQARKMREEQKAYQLTYQLASGQEKSIAIGQILHTYYPNQLSTLQRVVLFGRNMWTFLSDEPREANTEGGIFPALFGTFVMTVLMSLAVTPFGVMAAVYLREYARQGLWVRLVRIAVNNLAGVPSIVFGVFGLGFFVYLVGGTIDQLFFSEKLPTPTFGTGGLLWASLTLALMTVPVVIVSTEEALAAVGQGIREASVACGASKWQTIQRIILPAAAPGILTGMILAMARGAGEVAPLMLVGVVKLAPELPINSFPPYLHLDQKFMHLGFHIFDLGFQSPDSEAAKPMVFATTLLLIGLVFILNMGAIYLRERLRRKYASGAF